MRRHRPEEYGAQSAQSLSLHRKLEGQYDAIPKH